MVYFVKASTPSPELRLTLRLVLRHSSHHLLSALAPAVFHIDVWRMCCERAPIILDTLHCWKSSPYSCHREWQDRDNLGRAWGCWYSPEAGLGSAARSPTACSALCRHPLHCHTILSLQIGDNIHLNLTQQQNVWLESGHDPWKLPGFPC